MPTNLSSRLSRLILGLGLFSVTACANGALAPASSTATPVGPAGSAANGASGSGIPAAGAPVGGVSGPNGAAVAQSAAPAARGAVAAAAPSQAQIVPPVTTPGPVMVHGIVVSGNGVIRVKPDEATLTAGVQSRGTTAEDAQSQNNATMQKVVDAIKAAGIPDANVRTSGISLYPIYADNQVVTGYSASNNVVVVVDQMSQVGAVLDAATKAGANVESSVQFGLKDDSAAKGQALQAAAADAKAKANALASALGLQITSIESVSEGSVSTPVFVAPRAAAAAQSAASVPVQPGEMDVTAQVTIVFGY